MIDVMETQKSLILVAEDDENWQRTFRQLLNQKDYECDIVNTFGVAFDRILKSEELSTKPEIALCIVDLKLKGSDINDNREGLALLSICKNRKIPALVVSGFLKRSLEKQLFNTYAVIEYFDKASFDEEAFLVNVQEIVHRNGKNPQFVERITPMDTSIITPYIPVIVEATKLFLGEASNWIDNVRKKASATSIEKRTTIDLPISREEFSNIKSDKAALIAAINKSATDADFYEIEGTLKQIQNHRRSLTDLETKASDYGGNPPPEDNRRMEREAQNILEKMDKLEMLLSRIYSKSVI